MKVNEFFATCKFGLESVVADELRALGARDLRTENARVFFRGEWELMVAANLWLRCADRVFWCVGQFPADSFDALFEGVKALPWEDVLQKDAAFPVKGKTAASRLHSVSDCQAIVKKAIAERLKAKYGGSWCPETGKSYIVEVGLLKDVATIAIDASGSGLGRRGYRRLNAEAPLAETLAAALVQISRYKGDKPFWDPCCGSGTIAIEAAMIAQNIAPGRARPFAAEQWKQIPRGLWDRQREQACDVEIPPGAAEIAASDIDESVLSLARFHAENAGVQIRVFRADARQAKSADSGGQIICNPPYGERLLEKRDAQALTRSLGAAFLALPGWRVGVLSSDPQFERYFGRRADKRRKLYNSNLICQYYQYF